jgi:hypothetical protein
MHVTRKRRLVRQVALGGLAAVAAMGPALATAQVKCYTRKCYLYPDGSQVCERTPWTATPFHR